MYRDDPQDDGLKQMLSANSARRTHIMNGASGYSAFGAPSWCRSMRLRSSLATRTLVAKLDAAPYDDEEFTKEYRGVSREAHDPSTVVGEET
jgi:hypothetical protein